MYDQEPTQNWSRLLTKHFFFLLEKMPFYPNQNIWDYIDFNKFFVLETKYFDQAETFCSDLTKMERFDCFNFEMAFLFKRF